MKKIVTITVIIGTVSISICTYLFWRWMAKHKGGTLTKYQNGLGNFAICWRLLTTVVEISKENKRKGDLIVQQRGST